jgi:hypothetical protein
MGKIAKPAVLPPVCPLSTYPPSSLRRPPSRIVMSTLKWKRSLLMACIMATGSLAFHHAAIRCQLKNLSRHNGMLRRQHIHTTTMTASIATEANAGTQKRGGESPSGACYYRRIDGSWKPRKELNQLFIGERLFAARLPARYVIRHHLAIAVSIDPHCKLINPCFVLGRDLLDGKTGPKGCCTILSSISQFASNPSCLFYSPKMQKMQRS